MSDPIAGSDFNSTGSAHSTSSANPTLMTRRATRWANRGQKRRTSIPTNNGASTVTNATPAIDTADVRNGIEKMLCMSSTAIGMIRMESTADASSSPIVYDCSPPVCSALFGQIGGTGDTDNATSAI